jgi:hypothetical protein
LSYRRVKEVKVERGGELMKEVNERGLLRVMVRVI